MVLKVDMKTFCALYELYEKVYNTEVWDFNRAVEMARNGLIDLNLNPNELLFRRDIELRVV